MTTWNYRLRLKKADEQPHIGQSYYALYEVYYNEDGRPTARTEEPICGDILSDEEDPQEAKEQIVKMLKRMINSVENYEIFTDPEKWAELE